MVTEQMAVDYAQSILVAMEVDDFLTLRIDYDDPEEHYFYCEEGDDCLIIVGIDVLVRDFERVISSDELFLNCTYIKNKDQNSLAFSILHEIAHGIIRKQGGIILYYTDCVLRSFHVAISRFVDFLLYCKKTERLKKFSKWFDALYLYLPEEKYANKFADRNVKYFVPNYGLAE